MTTAIVAMVVGGLTVGGIVVRKRRARDGVVSSRWLTDHAQRDRSEYDGPVWQWPIDKRFTENGWWNRYQETERRKRA